MKFACSGPPPFRERRLVKTTGARMRATLLASVLLLGAAATVRADEELVLIASAQSHVDQLDSSAVRKMFLGLTVNHDGNRLTPVLNESDGQIKELFLQNVVSMSDSTYDRYVLRQTLIRGQTMPRVYKNNAELISAVAADPAVIGYAWARDVAHDPRIRILRVLWHD